jgi:hypothetical protein
MYTAHETAIRQTEIPALMESWVTITPSVKMNFKKSSSPYCRIDITCLNICLLRMTSFFVSCKESISGLRQIAVSKTTVLKCKETDRRRENVLDYEWLYIKHHPRK